MRGIDSFNLETLITRLVYWLGGIFVGLERITGLGHGIIREVMASDFYNHNVIQRCIEFLAPLEIYLPDELHSQYVNRIDIILKGLRGETGPHNVFVSLISSLGVFGLVIVVYFFYNYERLV